MTRKLFIVSFALLVVSLIGMIICAISDPKVKIIGFITVQVLDLMLTFLFLLAFLTAFFSGLFIVLKKTVLQK